MDSNQVTHYFFTLHRTLQLRHDHSCCLLSAVYIGLLAEYNLKCLLALEIVLYFASWFTIIIIIACCRRERGRRSHAMRQLINPDPICLLSCWSVWEVLGTNATWEDRVAGIMGREDFVNCVSDLLSTVCCCFVQRKLLCTVFLFFPYLVLSIDVAVG
jgi:hypothetical protein